MSINIIINKKTKMIEIFNNDLKFLIPEIYLVSGILGLLMLGVLVTKVNTFEKQLMIIKLAIILLCGYIILLSATPSINQTILFGLFAINPFTSFIKYILAISTIILFFMSYDYIKNEDVKNYELTILILYSVLGMILLVSS